MSRLQELMQELADTAARADIESYCTWKIRNRHRWYSTIGLDAEEKEFVDKAIEYLELRGKLERNRTNQALVMLKFGITHDTP